MRENVTIAYRGANYEIGRGPHFYGIWVAGAPQSQPLEWWPETPMGWSSAWARFTGIEVPGTIVAVSQPTAPSSQHPGPAGQSAGPGSPHPGPAGQFTDPAIAHPGPAGQFTDPAVSGPGPAGQFTDPAVPHGGPFIGSGAPQSGPAGQFTDLGGPPPGPAGQFTDPGVSHSGLAGQPAALAAEPGVPEGRSTSWIARPGRDGMIAAGLLAVGVIVGVAGLFPGYLLGASLASQAYQVVPHAIYLAAWSASAVLILLGGARLRLGALLGAGTSVVTFGLFFADAGTAIVDGAHAMGAGLVLGLAGWLLCALGSGMALWLRPEGHRAPGRPQGHAMRHVLTLVAALGGLGAAIAFAPSWDSYTLKASNGSSSYVTAGNAFANPGWVIAGDVAVMVALVAVVVVAALWRPVREGAVLLAGAAIPMAAQAISALVQLGQPTSPSQFGISPAEASLAGITITNGVTPVFWLYCAFVIVLLGTSAWILLRPRSVAALDLPAPAGPGGPHGTPAAGLPYGPAGSLWDAPAGDPATAPLETPTPAGTPAPEDPAPEPADALPDGFQQVADQ